MKEIRRINSYEDDRFDQVVLDQHGAFIIDDTFKCSFEITGNTKAVIKCDREIDIDEAIAEFRFYSENITEYYDALGTKVRSFPQLNLFDVDLNQIQPSQFFVNTKKVKALRQFIKSNEDIIIPVTRKDQYYVSLDGHTRLFIANQMGYQKVYAYLTEPGDYTDGFVEEAKNRGVHQPADLVLLSNDEYVKKWHRFCDDYFSNKK